MKKSLFLFLCLAFMSGGSVFAQETPRPHPGPLRFSHQDAESAYLLATSAILQDHEGFMWFGQLNSGDIWRHDGYEYVPYRHDPYDSLSVGPGIESVLFEDSEHSLWVGKTLGLSRFDFETDSFLNFSHNPDDSTSISPGRVWSILEDSQGNVWIGTDSGLNLLDRESGTFAHFLPDSTNPRIGPLIEDSQGVLWAGSWGLLRFDPSRHTFRRFLPDPSRPVLPLDVSSQSNWVNSIHEDERGRLWVGTWTGGLYRFDRETDTFENFRHDPSQSFPFASDGVHAIVGDPTGGLWLATHKEGLVWFDPETGEMTPYRNEPTDSYSLSGDNVLSLYEDRQGVFWAGSWWHDVNRFDRAARPVAHYYAHTDEDKGFVYADVPTMAEAADDVVWVMTTNTGSDNARVLTRIDRQAGTYTHFRPDANDPRSLTRWAYRVYVDRSAIVWTGGTDVLSRMDPASPGRFTHFQHDPADDRSLPAGQARIIYEDTQGRLWVGSNGFGLSRVDDRERGTVTRFPFAEDMGWVNHIFEDGEGVLWVGTYGGLFRFDPDTGQHVRYQQEPNGLAWNVVFSTYERAQEPGVLWLGLEVGLGRFEPATGSFRLFTTADGLPNNYAQGVLGDDDGRIWISTDMGLSRFDPETGTFNNYNVDDGLQGNSFTAFSFHKGRSGQLYFGGPNGLNAFYPDQLKDNPNPPQLALSSLRLGRETVKPNPNGPLKQRLANTSAITLAHNQNDLTLGFVGLHFRQSDKNRYKYILEPYDDVWSDTTAVRQASYTNLPPGDYTFRVTAANSDGIWNETPLALAITILPPWWRTWWAYAIYLLLVIGAAINGYRWQHERVVRREREATRERELEQAREIERQHKELMEAHTNLETAHTTLKSTQSQLIQKEKLTSLGALTAGIAHEIKNPVNFVNNFAEVSVELTDELLEDIKANPDLRAVDMQNMVASLKVNAEQIAKHGKRADHIVKTMMQHARAGSGERYDVGVNKLVDEYVTLAYRGMQAQETNLDVTIERNYDDSVGNIEMVPQEIGRALMNLLNNAFDAVNEKAQTSDESYAPKVSITTAQVNESIEVRISDNGSGVAEDVRSKIFEPFFTTKPSGKGHAGLGLSLAHDIVAQGHRGSLSLKTKEDDGALFTIVLPIQ